MKGKMLSPNNSNSDTRRCPDFKSSLQVWVRTADIFKARLSPLPFLSLLSEMFPWGICLEDDDGPMSGSVEGTGPFVSGGCMLDDKLVGTTSIGPSVAIFLRDGCCSKCSLFALRLSSCNLGMGDSESKLDPLIFNHRTIDILGVCSFRGLAHVQGIMLNFSCATNMCFRSS